MEILEQFKIEKTTSSAEIVQRTALLTDYLKVLEDVIAKANQAHILNLTKVETAVAAHKVEVTALEATKHKHYEEKVNHQEWSLKKDKEIADKEKYAIELESKIATLNRNVDGMMLESNTIESKLTDLFGELSKSTRAVNTSKSEEAVLSKSIEFKKQELAETELKSEQAKKDYVKIQSDLAIIQARNK